MRPIIRTRSSLHLVLHTLPNHLIHVVAFT
ncbi:hypothetical protein F383_06805 [Gossypium arboreum]|uniref:Uncharacterized protein n=1 Tax=Gossypium arboreum TaxID=29729 RepID=A0A0B0PI40_GOSAR|nr:hypothetical protein F383_06805 [Gossypium arboreum]